MQEQIEALDEKSKRHHRNRRSYPGEKGALVGGVIGEILDHDCLTSSRGLGPAAWKCPLDLVTPGCGRNEISSRQLNE
jgi:hypothetical protein